MDDNIYPIEVLHVVNPHIIFVEVRDKSNTPIIEQVGLYGIVPVNETVDINGDIITERTENWPLVATSYINKLLSGDVQSYFMLVQQETRSTIFDNNCVKFGRIAIKTGKHIESIEDNLEKLNIAEKNEALFQERLYSGSLKLKLNYVRTEEVLKAIRNYYIKHNRDKNEWEETINRQTILFQEAKSITNELTAKNLELLQRNEPQPFSALAVIERKTRDLELCKDADLASVGRASRRRKDKDSSAVHKTQINDDNSNSPSNMLKQIKRYLNDNSKVKNVDCLHSSDVTESAKLTETYETLDKANEEFWQKPYENVPKSSRILKYLNNMKMRSLNANDKNMDESLNDADLDALSSVSNNVVDEEDNSTKQFPPKKVTPSKNYHQDLNKNEICSELPPPPNISKGNITTLKTTPERLIAYGPPSKAEFVNLKIHKLSYGALSPYDVKTEKKIKKKCNENYSRDERDFDVIKRNFGEEKNEEWITAKNYQSEEEKVCNAGQNVEGATIQENNVQHSDNVCIKDKGLLKLLQRKTKAPVNTVTTNSDTSVDNTKENEEDIEIIKEKLDAQYKPLKLEAKKAKARENVPKLERNVNPFKNLDGSKSVFVDKLVGPILMVHTKNDNLILPQQNIRDVPFKTSIQVMLRNMNIKEPFRLQSVSWSYILRGHSMFMVGHAGGGKSLGYLPAVCNIVLDSSQGASLGPVCVIVCATAASVSWIEEHCKRFLGLTASVLSCYAGMDMAEFVPALLNGCDVLVITAPMFYRLLGTDFGVDLRRLTTLVFEDGERLSEVYAAEVKVIVHHVKVMLKSRVDTSWKVQYVVASRQWCDFMTPLAKHAPDSVIAIGAFHECVPYSKTPNSVQFVLRENKVNAVLEFLKEIDSSKRCVIVCRSDEEVEELETALQGTKRATFTCNNTMTVHDLYNLNVLWDKYEEPVSGPILVCCDGNLTHMNITNANYLVHFSMPELFTMFCKRFAVLNENYASIFEPQTQKVKVKILLEDSNSEQLPKILSFLRRCTKEAFPTLSDITRRVLEEKDRSKAERFVPICNTLMTLGQCEDICYCVDRHSIIKDFDEPKSWMPKEGLINFKITLYNSAVSYSARLLSNVTKSGTTKYANTFNTLHMKMGMFYSKETNRKPQGVIKLGDVCAIAVKPNFFERCQVVKILSYSKGNPHLVLVNLIDEERLETAKDVHLFHLPEEFRVVETYTVKVRLANVRPQDKDVTFSVLARDELKNVTDHDDSLFLRGEIVMTVGNCIFVSSLEACQKLSSLAETVVKHDFKKQLLSRHAEPNPDHIPKLEKLGGVLAKTESNVEVTTPPKKAEPPKWAHLDRGDFSTVIFAAAENAGEFFVRLEKFQTVIDALVTEIQKLVETLKELPPSEIYVGNIVLAEFPDDSTYERARIDAITNGNKVKCFFVDYADWREVSVSKLRPIPDHIIHRIPFQAIECRLVGVKPPSDEWTEFGNNWLCDHCFEDSQGRTKYLFAKYFTKEKAKITGGHKYGVILYDTSTEVDVMINKRMIELNLARANECEAEFLERPIDMIDTTNQTASSSDDDFQANTPVKDLVPMQKPAENCEGSPLRQLLFEKPIRSVPLVEDSSDDDSAISVNFNNGELMKMFKRPTLQKSPIEIENNRDLQKAITSGVSESSVSKDTSSSQAVEQTDSDDSATDRNRNKTLTKLKRLMRRKKVLESQRSGSNSEINRTVSELDSDDFPLANVPTVGKSPKALEVISRTPKLVWRQSKTSVTIKIQLIGVEKYDLVIRERSIKFNAYHDDTNYEFDFELYSVVDVKKCKHSSRGQYIQVELPKILRRNWLNLAKDCGLKNWIVYDVDALDTSSEEEVTPDKDQLEVLKRNLEQNDSGSDEDFVDDANFNER